MLCDAPMGYATRVSRSSPINLPDEVNEISSELLCILSAVYQAKLTMEHTSQLVKKKEPKVSTLQSTRNNIISPSFNSEDSSEL